MSGQKGETLTQEYIQLSQPFERQTGLESSKTSVRRLDNLDA